MLCICLFLNVYSVGERPPAVVSFSDVQMCWFSTAWMELLVDSFEAVLVDMCVDLGCGDIGMAQHELDGTQIGAPGQ